ncbi:MAG: hypothetical protein P9C48_02335 [Defluviicoccus sp.]|nr:hypothetical protein [Defluviicoccus sp.]MDG4607950.1 hypothetical protein [Defluviicoccus sp.]
MAYDPKRLSVLAYANGFTLWHYLTNDTAAAVGTAGYFNTATDMLRSGDMILANVDNAASKGAGVFVVKTNTGSVVDVANLTAFGTVNDA